MKGLNIIIIIILSLVIVYLLFFNKIKENLTDIEAISTIADMIDKNNFKVNDIFITGSSNITGNSNITGDSIINGGVKVGKDVNVSNNVNIDKDIIIKGNTEISNINKLCSNGVCLSSNDVYRMINYWSIKDKMFDNAKVYDDIYSAYSSGVIFKSGNPPGWDETSYRSNKIYDKLGLRVGTNSNYPNGLGVIVPNGCNMIWLSLLNERWNVFKLFKEDSSSLGLFCGGFRNLNTLYPDGSTTNSHYDHNDWVSMPVPGPGKYIICSISIPNKGGDDFWITGIGFSNNLWNYATNSALAYHWKINNEPVGMNLENTNWNNDILATFPPGVRTKIFVPVVPSNNDKLLFFIEHNSTWVGFMHAQVIVNNVVVGRIKTTYISPFSMHHNSKAFCRYGACLVPKSLINKNDTLLSVEVDMTGCNNSIKIREAGTHDYL